MLSILGRSHKHCDGIARREVLRIGGLALGGLSLPQLLQAESHAPGKRQKSVIMVFLSGGPPHQDMVDLKMDAPVEIRGEFKPISTQVPGIQICEHLPKLASSINHWGIIRSLVGSVGHHASFQCMTGWPPDRQPAGGWPSFGSAVSKLKGQAVPGIPAYVGLSPRMRGGGWQDPGQAGFAGQAHAPFAPNFSGVTLGSSSVSVNSLSERQSLMTQLDDLKRTLSKDDTIAGLDAYQQQAYGILTSGKLAKALDLEQEDPKLRDKYGRGSPENAGYGDAGPLMNDYFLAARRLIEAGVRVVSLAYGRWDWHGRPHGTNFDNARDHLPVMDQGLTALIEDLSERGMLEDTTVLVWGEFGRTPQINKNGGRDHWPNVACALMAGGGIRGGRVVGATDRLGGNPVDRPVHFQDVFATLYHNLGINTNTATINDLSGRPRYLVDHTQYKPIREII